MNLKEIGEFGLIERIKKIVDLPSQGLLVGIEDDAAAFRISKNQILLLSTDALIERIHFDVKYFSFFQLGWRAMAANLSDIAAMGGWPQYAVVTLAIPHTMQVESVEEMYRGMKTVADEFHTTIIGGDTSQSPNGILISLAVVGQVAESELTRRSGAQIGDPLFVTGTLGSSQAGLRVLKSQNAWLKEKYATVIERHLSPKPRLKEANFLATHFPIHSMIDISDGLAPDLGHICKQSGVGAIVFGDQLPIDADTKGTAEYFGDDPVEYVLYGGEDFELLFTVPEENATELQKKFHKMFGISCAKIGQIIDKTEGIYLEKSDNKKTALISKGYDHFRE
ncbi:MAG: thiamine-phosphate kinase [bacterium]